MEPSKYLLIGGGLASSRAAAQLRKHDSTGSITLVSDEPYVPYDRPPLSKGFLRGEQAREGLDYASEEALREQRIALVLATSVEELDVGDKTATLSTGKVIEFEKALIATGGHPARLDLPGEDLEGVYYFRTVDQATAIAAVATEGMRAVIVGAGFIGMEAAASLTQLGLAVTVLETEPRIWAHFADELMSDFFERYCSERGVTFLTSQTATAFAGDRRVSSVITASGHECPCDIVLVCVGIEPNVELALQAGLNVSDGIVVDDRMRTSHPDVYAAGDVVNYPDPIFRKRRRVEHWGHAEHSGQIAGRNMTGSDQAYTLLTYVWSDVFDLHLEFAGDATVHDRSLMRGKVEDGAFTVLYLRDSRLTAYFAINGAPREFAPLQKLIRRQIDLTAKDAELVNPDSSLRTLL